MSLNIIVFALVFIILALAGFILSLRRRLNEKKDQELDQKNAEIVSNITNQIQILSQNLGTIQKSVDQRLGENTSRLDNASRSYSEVQKQLVKLQEQTRRVLRSAKMFPNYTKF